MEDEARAKKRVEDLKQAIADALNGLEWKVDRFNYECENMGWNAEVVIQIEDACKKLGFALATLTNWYKDEDKANEQ